MGIRARRVRRPAAIVFGAGLALAAGLRGQVIDKIGNSELLVGVKGVQVPPIGRSDVANMVDVGTIDSEGFTHLTVNLAGELKGAVGQRGEIVAVLMPELAPFTTAHTTLGLLPAAFEITAPLSTYGGFYFMAKQSTMEVGFSKPGPSLQHEQQHGDRGVLRLSDEEMTQVPRRQRHFCAPSPPRAGERVGEGA